MKYRFTFLLSLLMVACMAMGASPPPNAASGLDITTWMIVVGVLIVIALVLVLIIALISRRERRGTADHKK